MDTYALQVGPRRRHSAGLKAQDLAECEAPDASVAAVAQSHGLNANLVHKWRRQAGSTKSPAVLRSPVVHQKSGDAFVALQLPATRAPSALPDIRIELRRGTTTINIAWPAEAASECVAWLREWLR